jgi:hypothetical protein
MNAFIENQEPARQLIQAEPHFLEHRTFVTRLKESVDFQCYCFLPDYQENLYFTTHIVEALIHQQQCGYIILNYLDKQTVTECFDNVASYFFHFYGDKQDLEHMAKPDTLEYIVSLSKKLHVYDQDIQQAINKTNKNEPSFSDDFIQYYKERLIQHLYLHYGHSYEQFLANWMQRPHVELITVYQADDKFQKNFQAWPYEKMARAINAQTGQYDNFRGQGIAQALYEVAGLWMQSLGMYINSGMSQTPDGEKMWNILSEHQHFQVLPVTQDNEQNSLQKGNKKLVVI